MIAATGTHLRASSSATLEAAYIEHYERIRKYLCAQLSDKATADDLAVEAFILLGRKLEEGVTIYHAGAYLTTLADGLLRNEVQRLARSVPSKDMTPGAVDDEETNYGPMTPVWHAGTTLTLEDIEFQVDHDRAVRALDSDPRNAYILTELRGLTVREASEVLDVGKSTADRWAAEARARIRTDLTP